MAAAGKLLLPCFISLNQLHMNVRFYRNAMNYSTVDLPHENLTLKWYLEDDLWGTDTACRTMLMYVKAVRDG